MNNVQTIAKKNNPKILEKENYFKSLLIFALLK